MDLRSMRFGGRKFYELFAGPNGNDADNLGTFRKLERGLSAASRAAKKFPYVVLHEYIGGRDDSDWNDTVFSQDKSQQEEECDMAKKKKSAAKPAVKVEKAATEGQSRNQLMETVKSRGIKNFRVMNKAELAEIVGGAKADRVLEIQKQAVERWKSGWGTKKEK